MTKTKILAEEHSRNQLHRYTTTTLPSHEHYFPLLVYSPFPQPGAGHCGGASEDTRTPRCMPLEEEGRTAHGLIFKCEIRSWGLGANMVT